MVNGAKTDGIDSLARQLGARAAARRRLREGPWPGGLAIPPGNAAARRRRLGGGRRAAPQRRRLLTAPGMFSPDAPIRAADASPPPARAAEGPRRRPRRRLGLAGACSAGRCPGIAAIDLYEAEARALDAARMNVADPRAGFHWADVARLGRGRAALRRGDRQPAVPPRPRRRARPRRRLHRRRRAHPEARRPPLMVANRQLPYEAALDAALPPWERLSEDAAFKVIAAERPRRR